MSKDETVLDLKENKTVRLFQLKSLWHPAIVLISAMFLCAMLVIPANAATCTIGSPICKYGETDFVGFTITATADNGGLETDTLTLYATYYDQNGTVIGTYNDAFGTSHNITPVNGSRSYHSPGTSIILNGMPSGTTKTVYHYEIEVNVVSGGVVVANASFVTPDRTV